MAGTDLVRKNLYALSVDNTSLFQDIREKAWDRMLRRLESSSVIDDTHLIRLFVEVTKIQASLESKVHEGKDEKEVEIMDLVTDAGVPQSDHWRNRWLTSRARVRHGRLVCRNTRTAVARTPLSGRMTRVSAV